MPCRVTDSTGIKLLGDGEWQARKHGPQGRRQWRKVHLAMDPATSDSGLTPYEYICKIWRSEPGRLILNPIHLMPGLNTQRAPALQRCTIGRPVPGLVARGGGLLMQPSYHAGFTR